MVVDEKSFEAKRAEADFELVWAKLSQMSFESLKEAHRYSYMAGRGAGRKDDLRKEIAMSYREPIKEKV